jgi:hypothetical protein
VPAIIRRSSVFNAAAADYDKETRFFAISIVASLLGFGCSYADKIWLVDRLRGSGLDVMRAVAAGASG